MTEKEALASSNNWVNINEMIGYFSFEAANFLIGTGKYQFQQAGWMGYIIKKKINSSQDEIFKLKQGYQLGK